MKDDYRKLGEAGFIARDLDGSLWFYFDMPVMESGYWIPSEGFRDGETTDGLKCFHDFPEVGKGECRPARALISLEYMYQWFKTSGRIIRLKGKLLKEGEIWYKILV